MSDLLGFHFPLVRRGIFKGVDLNALAERLWRLEAMRADGAVPALRWCTSASSASGTAWGNSMTPDSRRITVRLSEDATVERAAELVLHELVHCACPPREHHGELFCRRLIAAAREAFGLPLDTAELLALPAGIQGKRAYAIDTAIIEAMQAAGVGARLREDVATRFEPPPAETCEEVAARRAAAAAARIVTREAHARAMLAAWERKLAGAKRIAQKWRSKVRYYERRQEAAKRGPSR